MIRQPRAEERRPQPAKVEPSPLILSARSAESLSELAATYRERLEGASAAEAAAIANAAAYQRERLPHRLIALPEDREGQVAALDAFLAGEKAPTLATGKAASRDGKTAFVFSGNGSQHVGMGRAAYENDPIFRATFDTVSTIFEKLAGVGLVEAMFSEDLADRLPYTSLAQPLIFAVQAATVESLSEKGLKPDAVLGHSVGEVAAAWAAGAFDLPDAVRLIHARSRSQEKVKGRGTMAAVLAGAPQAEEIVAEAGLDIAVAADNSVRSVTISGAADQIAAFAKVARKRKIACKTLDLDYPFHSPLTAPLEDDLLADLDWLRPQETRIPYLSATFGELTDGEALGPRYWWTNIRQPVLFRQGLEAAIEMGCACFVEVGPRPVLGAYIRDTAADRSANAAVLPTLEEKDALADLRRVVAAAAVQGAGLVENRFFGHDEKPDLDLPLYPWRRQTFRNAQTDEAIGLLDPRALNPLLGAPVRQGARDWRAVVDCVLPDWLGDHRVGGAAILPGAGYVDMALTAGLETLGEGPIELVRPRHPAAAADGGGRGLRAAHAACGRPAGGGPRVPPAAGGRRFRAERPGAGAPRGGGDAGLARGAAAGPGADHPRRAALRDGGPDRAELRPRLPARALRAAAERAGGVRGARPRGGDAGDRRACAASGAAGRGLPRDGGAGGGPVGRRCGVVPAGADRVAGPARGGGRARGRVDGDRPRLRAVDGGAADADRRRPARWWRR